MRKVFTFFAAVLLTATLWAQSPEKMSYQAVIRNSGGTLVTSTLIGMEINIRQGSPTGTVVYTETQTPTTNANGLVSIEIGGGTGFNTINWANGPYFIETNTAVVPPLTTYTITGTSQLLSVPYALYAKTAGSISGTSGHYVGELYGGGIVFYVDETGLHGLIASLDILSYNMYFSNIQTELIGISAQSIWDGLTNSNAIVGQASHTTSAAKLCLDYTNPDFGTGIFSDWYLPASDELVKIAKERYDIDMILELDGNPLTITLGNNTYISSTEFSSSQSITSNFLYLNIANNNKSYIGSVRAVRAF